jgi:hypothetical protein
MARQRRNPEAKSDAGVIAIGVMLATAAAAFAGSMLYTGPLLPGRDFRLIDLAANRQNKASALAEADELSDPIITGSLAAETVISSPREVPDWFRAPGRAIGYRLKSAGAGRAVVNVSSGPVFFLYQVEPGAVLPGLGRVRAIGIENGHWQIVTERSRVSTAGAFLMREQDAGEGAEPGE